MTADHMIILVHGCVFQKGTDFQWILDLKIRGEFYPKIILMITQSHFPFFVLVKNIPFPYKFKGEYWKQCDSWMDVFNLKK